MVVNSRSCSKGGTRLLPHDVPMRSNPALQLLSNSEYNSACPHQKKWRNVS
jgi:hypothetical protein